jgi:predicted transcriptional regulator
MTQKVSKTFRLDKSTVERVQHIAERLGMSQTEVIENAVAHLALFYDDSVSASDQLQVMSQRLLGLSKALSEG